MEGTLNEVFLGRDGSEGEYVDIGEIDEFSSIAFSRGTYSIELVSVVPHTLKRVCSCYCGVLFFGRIQIVTYTHLSTDKLMPYKFFLITVFRTTYNGSFNKFKQGDSHAREREGYFFA